MAKVTLYWEQPKKNPNYVQVSTDTTLQARVYIEGKGQRNFFAHNGKPKPHSATIYEKLKNNSVF